MKKIQSVAYIVYLFILIYNFFYTSLACNVGMTLLRNIEIVSPYVTDIEYKELKSSFYQMKSHEDYSTLDAKIKLIMESNNLSIEK